MRKQSRDQVPERFPVELEARLALPTGESLPCIIRECSQGGQSVELISYFSEAEELPGEFAFIEFELPGSGDFSLAVMVKQAAERRIELSYLSPQPELTDVLRGKGPDESEPVQEQESQSDELKFSSPQLQQIRREFVAQAIKLAREALGSFGEVLEENLFDAADRAVSNQVQTELMFYYRRRSEDCSSIEHTLIAELRKLIEALGSETSTPSAREDAESEIESMTLIDPDEMESWVLMTNLAATAEKRNLEQLSHLTTRINALFHIALDREAIPLSPGVACDIFSEGIRELSLPLVIKRVYWQSFGETFLKELSGVYANLNTLLKERGVIPDIARSYVVRKAPASQPPRAAVPPDQTDQPDDDLTAPPGDIPDGGTLGDTPVGGTPGDIPVGGTPADLPEEGDWLPPPLSRQELQDFFQEFRQEQDAGYRQGDMDYVSLLEILSQRVGDVEERLAPRDLRSLELAETVFKGLTTSQGLPTDLRHWILGLEDRVTAAILNDESFIVSREHPARRFISELAEIGAAGAPLDRELLTLLPEIDDALDGAGEEPEDAFTEALSRIEPLLERKRNQEFRNIEETVERCQVEEMLDQARHRIGELLVSRVGPVQLPRFLVNLIEFGWRHLLTRILLQRGFDSPEWQQALDLTDQMVDGFGGEAQPDLSRVTMMNRAERLMTENQCLHVVESPAFRKAKEAAYQLEYGREPQLPAGDLEQIPLESTELGQELLARTWEQAGQEEDMGSWLATAERFPIGSWFKHIPGPEQETNLRLSWIDQEHFRFVFVNTVGIKTLDLRHPEFAQRLKDQQLIPVQGHDIAIVDESISQVLEKLYARLAYQASHDDLTGLVNRKEFERRLQLALESAKSGQADHVLGFITLHQVDTIRKICGFEAGNEALREISNLFNSDLPDQGTLSRTGVDQFSVLHEQCSRTEALRLAREYITLVESYRYTYEDVPYALNISFGLVAITADSSHARSVLNAAELACAAAQQSGRNAIHVFREGDETQLGPDLDETWTVRINQALDQNRLALRAQKIAPLQTGSDLTHYEILLSVLDGEGNPTAPGEFIEAAERLGLMSDVDRWVVRQVFSWMATYQETMGQIELLSVNLSGQSLSGGRMLGYIREQLSIHQTPEHKVCFEITETAAVANIDDAVDLVTELRNMGCKVSLDDFGSGLSSYAYLKSLPSDFLKIDGSLVKDICRLPSDLAMVRSINEIAHFMDKQVVAEYAENQEIVDKLREVGVDFAQGWGIAKPVMLADLAQPQKPFVASSGGDDSTAAIDQGPN